MESRKSESLLVRMRRESRNAFVTLSPPVAPTATLALLSGSTGTLTALLSLSTAVLATFGAKAHPRGVHRPHHTAEHQDNAGDVHPKPVRRRRRFFNGFYTQLGASSSSTFVSTTAGAGVLRSPAGSAGSG